MHLWKQNNRVAAEKIAKENARHYNEVLVDLWGMVDKACVISEIGTRYLALNTIEETIRAHSNGVSERIEKQKEALPGPADIRDRGFTVSIAGIVTAVIGTAVTAIVLAPMAPVVAGVGVTMYFGGIACALGGKRPKHSEKVIELVEMDKYVFQGVLGELQERITRNKKLITDNLPALAKSPHFLQICQRDPVLKESLWKAIAWIAEGDLLKESRWEFADASTVADPAERYLALERLRQRMEDFQNEAQEFEANICEEAEFDIQPVLDVMLEPRELHIDQQGISETTGRLLCDIENRKKDILNSDLASLVESPRFEELCGSAAEVKDAFIRAAAKGELVIQRALKISKPSLKS